MITLFESDTHKNLMFNKLGFGKMIQANQHLIIDDNVGILLDPGGHKIHTRLFAELSSILPIQNLKYLFMSHQDPDIVAASNAWLMMTDAIAFLPSIWARFVSHFGIDKLSDKRLVSIPDEGTSIELGNTRLTVLPAHFLHSSGNFNLYDPVSRILYSGDIGASPAAEYEYVDDFDKHIQYIEPFHKRYMPSSKAIRLWADMARSLDIETIAPQHGAVMKGTETVKRFIDWFDSLKVGVDVMEDVYKIPAG